MENVFISALGAISSVGRDVKTLCAAIRAGITRPNPLDGYRVLDIMEYDEIPVTGHPVTGITDGFSDIGRWFQLSIRAIDDLCRNNSVPSVDDSGFWSKTMLFVVIPFLDERFYPDPNCTEEMIEEALLKPLIGQIAHLAKPEQAQVLPRGRVGVLEIISKVGDILEGGFFERVIILATDSLTDVTALKWLDEHNRIKSDLQPNGLIPGEAAVAIMIETGQTIASREGRPIARLLSVATADEPKSMLWGERSQGEALAQVIETALLNSALPERYSAPVIVDLNGEDWRAEEFGFAQLRVEPSLWDGYNLNLPAMSIGDVGAAFSALQVAVACRSLTRRYGGGESMLMSCSDEHGLVGAAIIGR